MEAIQTETTLANIQGDRVPQTSDPTPQSSLTKPSNVWFLKPSTSRATYFVSKMGEGGADKDSASQAPSEQEGSRQSKIKEASIIL